MAINIVVPEFAWGKFVSTKDLIISILAEQWPLAAKQIFNRVSRHSETQVTYQAVHKMLSQLVKENILVKSGPEYQLNQDWIKQIKKFSDNLTAIYSSEKSIPTNYGFEKPIFFSFNNLSELTRFIIYDFHGVMSNPPKETTLCLWNHAWPVFGLSDKEYTFIKNLFSCGKYYSLTRCNTPLDKLFNKMFEQVGKKIICGVPFSAHQDTFVHDDIILQVFFPQEITKQMEKIYTSVNKIGADDLTDLFKDLISKDTKLSVVIFKNPELAKKLREEALAIFAKAKK